MPYIKRKRRFERFGRLEGIFYKEDTDNVKGDLTYCAYKLALDYMKSKGVTFKKKSNYRLEVDIGNYQNISDAISALEDAAYELRRRFLNDYEDIKIFENSDIE